MTTKQLKLGQWTLLEPLGKGSFGVVYKASDKDGNIRAVKILLNNKYLYSISRELKILKIISELNKDICEKYAVCYYGGEKIETNKDHFYISVMDYIDGYDLFYKIEHTPLKIRLKNNKILYDLIRGLDILHKSGITHQDIKESNIMWDLKTKSFRYIDWGNGCLKKDYNTDEYKKMCGLIGTVYTAPPEMYDNNITKYKQSFDETRAHDIWSLGVVLYDWYTLITVKINEVKSFDSFELIKNINKIYNQLARKCVKLMLERDIKTRLNNWDVIVAMLRKYESHKYAVQSINPTSVFT